MVVSFVRYMRNHGLTNVDDPDIPSSEKREYRPHAFSKDEIKRFFEACDNYQPFHYKSKNGQNNIHSIPVFFRLLYSTGMRTVECRMLRYEDVNLDSGVISITNTKGYEPHYVVMHDSMLDIMIDFDKKMQIMYPDRKFFFCNDRGGCKSRDWVLYHFRSLWDSVNDSDATAYEFRHNYISDNSGNS